MQLPGLDHLIAVLKAHEISVELHLPLPGAPHAGDQILGEPLDPILAAVYSRFDGGRLGDLYLFRTAGPKHDLVSFNEVMRRGAEERVKKLLQYGGRSDFAYYLATIPSLAAHNGIQPVAYFLDYVDKSILPIASTVDRAFELYACYCEARIKAYGSLDGVDPARPIVHFPDDFLPQILQDELLVQMLSEGRFEEFIAPDPDSREWVERILSAAYIVR